MWHAIKHRKVERMLGQQDAGAPAAWQATLARSEDLLTAAVLERLAYLPGTLAMEVVLRCADVVSARWVPIPEVLLDSQAWPRPGDEESVEPDWVWLTEHYAVIFEAKWGSGVVPQPQQLSRQSRVCLQRWPAKRRLHVALVQSGAVAFPPGVDGVVVCWSTLRQAVARLAGRMEEPAHRRVLVDIRDILDSRGLSMVYFGSLASLEVTGLLTPFAPPPQPPRPLPTVLDLDIPAITW